MLKEDYIVLLANKIVQGKCSYSGVKLRLTVMKKIFGDFNMPYEVENIINEEYLNELNEMVHMGVYSDEMLLKMAEISSEINADKIKKNNMVKIAVPCALLIVVVLFLLIRRNIR